jgi:hypothetical protein
MQYKKIFIGIDPGISGGIAWYDEETQLSYVKKMPQNILEFISFWQNFHEIHGNKQIFCLTEKVHSMPTNGAKSNFTFGYNLGVLHTCLTNFKIPFDFVTPQAWMKSFFMKKDKNETGTKWKNRLKQKAQQLYPDHKVTLWSADALLILEYCIRMKK